MYIIVYIYIYMYFCILSIIYISNHSYIVNYIINQIIYHHPSNSSQLMNSWSFPGPMGGPKCSSQAAAILAIAAVALAISVALAPIAPVAVALAVAWVVFWAYIRILYAPNHTKCIFWAQNYILQRFTHLRISYAPWCWNIYPQNWVILAGNVGKYSIHGAYGIYSIMPTSD